MRCHCHYRCHCFGNTPRVLSFPPCEFLALGAIGGASCTQIISVLLLHSEPRGEATREFQQREWVLAVRQTAETEGAAAA